MGIFIRSKNRTIYFNSNEKNSAYELGLELLALMKKHLKYNRNIVFLWSGQTATGDCLPIIGYSCSNILISHIFISMDF